MKMIRMTKEKFYSYVQDERKAKYRSHPYEFYYLNPQDAHGKPSSFVAVVVLGPKMGEVYVGVSKYNTFDTKKVSRPIPTDIPEKQQKKIKATVIVSGFTLEEGLKQACNRAWREMMDMPSLYGKDHGPQQRPGATLNRLSIMMTRMIRTIPPFPFDTRSKYRELMAARKHADRRLLTTAKQLKGGGSEAAKGANLPSR